MVLAKVKNWAVVLGFVVCTLSAYVSLLIGYPLSFFSPKIWRAWLDLMKGTFGMLLPTMLSLTSPVNVRIYSKHDSMRFRLKPNGVLQSTLSPRTVLMSNHQVYTDWMFLWWLAYSADLQSAPIIALKKSLRKIPVLGWAMVWLKFLFLSRKWSDDETHIYETTEYLAEDRSWPVWMCLFPEGTVFNSQTWSKTETYAARNGVSQSLVPRNMLLPRIKGLQAILRGLKGSMPVLYDVTMVYEPMPPASHAAESYFSLGRTFIEGKGPKTIKMHIREFAISQIPYKESEEVFTQWLYERWAEKDEIYRSLSAGTLESEFQVEAPVRSRSLLELYQCFNVPLTLGLVSRLLYKLVSGGKSQS